MDELMISVKDFIEMFMAISYVQEQRIFSYRRIKKYVRSVNWSDDTADFTYDDLIGELDTVFHDMLNDGIVSRVNDNDDDNDNENALYRISDKINYREIIGSNQDSLRDMLEVFYNICGGNDKVIYIVPSKTFGK